MKSQIQSLYVQTENQQLLWDMINKTQQLGQAFPKNDQNSQMQKQTWFRGIIADFHNKTPVVQNRDQLLAMNRQTLSYMMNQLNSYNIQPSTQQQSQSQTPSQQPPSQPQQSQQLQSIDSVGTMYSRNLRTENREETYKRQFEEREREYKSMSAPPELPKVNFAMSEDIAIANMAELVEEHRKLRELDVQSPPQTPVQLQPTQTQNYQNDNSIIKLKLQEDLPTEIISDQLYSLDVNQSVSTNEKRRVTFATDSENNIQLLKNEITGIKSDIKEMKDVLFLIFDILNPEKINLNKENVEEENREQENREQENRQEENREQESIVQESKNENIDA